MNALTITTLALYATSAAATPLKSASAHSTAIHVSQTASGPNVFRTVQEGINAVPEGATSEQLIFVDTGIYSEQVIVPRNKPFITMVGAGDNSTVVQFDGSSHATGSSVTPTTFQVKADDFNAFGMTFMNTNTQAFLGADGARVAGPSLHFRPAHWDLQLAFYKNNWIEGGTFDMALGICIFSGSVDYIWGRNGAAFFRNCTLNTLRSGGYVLLNSTFGGYVLEACTLTAPEGVTNWFLGRPWGTGATAFYVDSFIPDTVDPAYWHTMTAGATPVYSTINCTGPGAKSDSVDTTLSVVVSSEQAEEFLTLNAWLPDASSWIQDAHHILIECSHGVFYSSVYSQMLLVSGSLEGCKGEGARVEKRASPAIGAFLHARHREDSRAAFAPALSVYRFSTFGRTTLSSWSDRAHRSWRFCGAAEESDG
ncbi:pectin lyase fold/virulence factor [Blyttiomyces helicus]|uniref:pectinesterase n=1 Tax=Blyttiomyces helicus TaxID=388810 RepID=A0A4P9WEZ4_9FUNG|nr:pectin lyase fold/virulence factor [Blyttiomyces helicus]|eukprot:RKO91301.1 pectin lyase fold/virulence factor [Blyttiomyces helicus]